MRTQIAICLLLIFMGSANPLLAHDIPWKVSEIIPGGRIDAIAYAGNRVVIAGTRSPNPGWIFYSTDNGVNWQKGQQLASSEKRTGITCVACSANGLCFALNESSELYRSTDYGKTWARIGKVSTGVNQKGGVLSYGLLVTKQGTLLISDTNTDGGYVYRSTDEGRSFTRVGPVSTRGLYRFETVRDGVMVNGWAGGLYKSVDDGLSWELWSQMDTTALYATEFMRPETIVQASESGYIFTADQDKKEKFTTLQQPGGAADDFAYIGYNTLIYSTYTGSKSVFISYDRGKSWVDEGPVPTGVAGDWLDHVIPMELGDSVIAIGGTNKGFIVRAAFARSSLYAKTFDSKKYAYNETFRQDLGKGLVGSLFDPKELDEGEDVLIDGKYAYVPCRGSNNLAVIDISDPANPLLASSFRDPELIDAMGVAKHGNYLYLVSFSNHKCLVLDAKDPGRLKKLFAFTVGTEGPTPDRLRKVVYQDGYLYFTHSSEGKLYIADAHDPARPTLISDVKTGDGAFAVFVRGKYAYVGGCFPGSSLKVIDVSDKKNPRVVSTLADSARYGCTCSFQSEGNRLIAIAYSSNSLTVYDISDPSRPREEGFIQSDQLYGPNRLALIGKKAYMINSINDCLVELDLSSPAKPAIDWVVPS
ncbi:MAG: hypothetical protein Q8938_11855, partial [Bacteroidota bacterium]|nr:hypothetical protein [Bacteroidota bacterium]